MKYYNRHGKAAIIIDTMVAGMCERTFGYTFIVYKYDGDIYNYHFIMESKEFFNKHKEAPIVT